VVKRRVAAAVTNSRLFFMDCVIIRENKEVPPNVYILGGDLFLLCYLFAL
jgi:hypothetical protein